MGSLFFINSEIEAIIMDQDLFTGNSHASTGTTNLPSFIHQLYTPPRIKAKGMLLTNLVIKANKNYGGDCNKYNYIYINRLR